jgi:hypothetical protein
MRNKRLGNTKFENDRIVEGLPPWTSVSFAMGGWLQFYMYGVARAMQARGLDRGVRYCGASAGALAAVGLAIGGDFDIAVEFCKSECLPRAYGEFTGLWNLSEYVSNCINLTVTPMYGKGITPGILNVAVTRLPFLTAEVVSSFESADDLKQCLLASSAAFPFARLVHRKGCWLIDGGLSNFQPVIDDDTLTVSPFYFSDADIKPSRYVPLWWSFFPPNSSNTVDWLYSLGWEDAMAYFDSRGIPTEYHSPGLIRNTNSLSAPMKAAHPYDIPRQITMRRLLGYDYTSITANIVMFILDFLLLLCFLLIFKPLALLLIYLELYVSVVVYALVAIIGEVLEAAVVRLLATMANLTHIGVIGRFMDSSSTKLSNAISSSYYTKLWECITCITSLSLFLRFVSLRPSNATLRKHKHLDKLSVFYRVFRHII